jgi:hypothetical protein
MHMCIHMSEYSYVYEYRRLYCVTYDKKSNIFNDVYNFEGRNTILISTLNYPSWQAQ